MSAAGSSRSRKSDWLLLARYRVKRVIPMMASSIVFLPSSPLSIHSAALSTSE